MKRCAVTWVFVFALLATLYADQRIILASDEVYRELESLLIAYGLAVPSTSGPFTVSELEAYTALLQTESMSPAERRTLAAVEDGLFEHSVYGEPGGLSIHLSPELALESYLHSNDDNPEWFGDYSLRRPVVRLPVSFAIGDTLYAIIEAQVRKEPIIMTEEPSYLLNLPRALAHIDYQIPHRAFVSLGGNHWNLQFGRDAASWGNGATGNFVLSDALEYHDYLRVSTFWRTFKYQAMFINLESWSSDNIAEQSELYRSYLLHRVEARFFGRLNLAVTEGISIEGRYQELRYFNPMMIFHNWFLNDRYGNIIFGVEGEYTIVDGVMIYAQYVLDQKTSRFERDYYSADSEPDSLGYLAGAKLRIPVGPGMIHGDIEIVLTTPWLYIISGQPDFTEERKRISNYLRTKYLHSGPLGYGYGPDTILFDVSAGYRISELVDARLQFRYRIQGENTLETRHELGPDAIAMTTPSGDTPETRTVLRAVVTSTLLPWLELGAEIAWLRDRNDDHVEGDVSNDLQAILRLGVSY